VSGLVLMTVLANSTGSGTAVSNDYDAFLSVQNCTGFLEVKIFKMNIYMLF